MRFQGIHGIESKVSLMEIGGGGEKNVHKSEIKQEIHKKQYWAVFHCTSQFLKWTPLNLEYSRYNVKLHKHF